jgi:hypothetical protein
VSFVAETQTDSYPQKFFVVVARNFFRDVQSKQLILTSKAMPSSVRKNKRLKVT